MSLHDNDDEAAGRSRASFAQGHVALILVESILHVLVERKVLTLEDAVSAVQTAGEVKLAMSAESGETPEQLRTAIDSLFRIMDSFASDLHPLAHRNARADWDRTLGTE